MPMMQTLVVSGIRLAVVVTWERRVATRFSAF
jgi:hypothetical protein